MTAAAAHADVEVSPTEGDFEAGVSDTITETINAGNLTPDDLRFRAGVGEDAGESCWNIVVDNEGTEEARESGEGGPNTTWIDTNDAIGSLVDSGVAERLNGLFSALGLNIALPTQRCPGSDPVDIMRVVWTSMACPPPPPTPLSVQPDARPVTGLRSFLTIGGDAEVAIPCLGETIVATPRYVVTWGDGSEPTSTSTQGGPFPDGDLTHVYTHAGPVTLQVDAYWTGRWNDVTFPELPVPTSDQLDLGVREVRAVRTR